MPVCEVATTVGEKYRYEWEPVVNAEGPFESELLESTRSHRLVTAERMIGMPGEGSGNELTLIPIAAGTLLALVITFPDAAGTPSWPPG